MIKAAIFDLGGVLIDDPKVSTFWSDSEQSVLLRDKFGCGKLTQEEFIEKGAVLMGIDKDTFLTKYIEAYSGMSLVKSVWEIYSKISVPRYIFSDTNPIHFNFCKKLFPEIFTLADKLYLSFETGYRKSSIEAYQYLVSKQPYHTSELVFIDNNQGYVDTATKLGIHSICLTNTTNLLEELNLLDSQLIKTKIQDK